MLPAVERGGEAGVGRSLSPDGIGSGSPTVSMTGGPGWVCSNRQVVGDGGQRVAELSWDGKPDTGSVLHDG